MAEDQDQSQKTEEPSQRRLEDARRKGQVASSREVNHLCMLGTAAFVVAAFGPALARDLGAALMPWIAAPHAIPTDPGHLGRALAGLLVEVGTAAALPVLALLAAALLAGLVQNGPVWSAAPLAPKLERISPVAGARRLFSLRALLEFAKGLLKMALVAATGVALLRPSAPALVEAAGLEAPALLAAIADLSLRLLLGAVALTAVIGGADVLYQRFEHRKQLRMSRRDLQDEFKQTEGDPYVKARLKSLRMERARRRMMAEVPKATVVVTNPTHVAVALRYEATTMAAPVLVAKGQDTLAQRIREVARAHRVPVVENPALARTLHGAVEVGGEIPPAHYRAVAELIGYVMRLRPSPQPGAR